MVSPVRAVDNPVTLRRADGESGDVVYRVRPGDTLWDIARRAGVSLSDLIAANPQIVDPDRIAPGDRVVVPQAGTRAYTVQPGDTLWDIARRAGVSLSDLIAANPQIVDPDRIAPGDQVVIPHAGTRTYTVQPGDTLSEIAQRFDTSVSALAAANGIADPDLIRAGAVLRVPAVPTAPTSATAPTSPTSPTSPTAPSAPASSTEPPVPRPDASPATPATRPVPPSDTGNFDLQRIEHVRNNPAVTPEFLREVEAMAGRLGTRPEYLLAVMSFESRLNPAAVNPLSGATGLIQFIPETARGLGTSTAALRGMTAMEQLPFVEAYFAQYRGSLGTLEGTYTAVLSGRARPDPSSVLFERGSIAYTQNAALDANGDGRITSGEATQQVAMRLFGGTTAVQQALLDAGVVPEAQRARFVDGALGPNTRAAIAAFQARAGLPVTGLLDVRTGAALTGTSVPETSGPDAGPLQRGANGAAVRALQDDLVRLGLISRSVVERGYGQFGPATELAVRDFQRAVGLSPSGVVDQATARAIEAVIGGVGVARNPNADVIRAVQTALVERGHLTPADLASERGAFGPATEAALRAFQAEAGIGRTGVLGVQTFDALLGRGAGASGSWPVPGHTTINRADRPGEGDGEFGAYRSGNRRHLGIDINAPVGARVEAYRSGEVIFAGSMRGYGNTVIVQHDGGLQTVYAHLDRIDVRVGDRVTERSVLGTVGRSGNVPPAGDSHLHFEVRENARGVLTGTPVDPRRYLGLPPQ